MGIFDNIKKLAESHPYLATMIGTIFPPLGITELATTHPKEVEEVVGFAKNHPEVAAVVSPAAGLILAAENLLGHQEHVPTTTHLNVPLPKKSL